MLFYLILLVITLVFLVSFIAWVISHLISCIYGIPFVVSSDDRTDDLIKLLNPEKNEKIIDLGSGDGKLLIEIAKRGAHAYGYEINPVAYLTSIFKTRKLKRIKVSCGDFMKQNLSKYDAIVIYGFPSFMPRLEKKLLNELKPGARVVSNYFKFPNWKPAKKRGNILLYMNK